MNPLYVIVFYHRLFCPSVFIFFLVCSYCAIAQALTLLRSFFLRFSILLLTVFFFFPLKYLGIVSLFSDCILHCCCHCCAIAQEYREIKVRGPAVHHHHHSSTTVVKKKRNDLRQWMGTEKVSGESK